jgi:hypothetical protein
VSRTAESKMKSGYPLAHCAAAAQASSVALQGESEQRRVKADEGEECRARWQELHQDDGGRVVRAGF